MPVFNPSRVPTQEGWIAPTLLNGWQNFNAATHATAGYWKDSFGVVHLRGLVRSGSLNAAIFTLPTGYRIAGGMESFFAASSESNVLGGAIVTVFADGSIQSDRGTTFVSLAGITFRAS